MVSSTMQGLARPRAPTASSRAGSGRPAAAAAASRPAARIPHAQSVSIRTGFSSGSPASIGHVRRDAAADRAAQWRHPVAAAGTAVLEGIQMPIPPPPHPTFDLTQVIQAALDEDAGGVGDVTTLSTIPEDRQGKATYTAKATGTLAGIAVAEMVCKLVDPSLVVEWTLRDGDRVETGVKFGTITGSARSILVAERVALNFMQRMSGIATATRAMVDEAAAGGPSIILETRKTVPGLRLFDKWAVVIGGGKNHRMGLYDMVMIKDNHIAAAGGIKEAVTGCGAWLADKGMEMEVEVECSTITQVEEVLAILDSGDVTTGRPTRIMLDNMCIIDPAQEGGVDVSLMKEAVDLIDGRVETEASGNVTLGSVRKISSTGVTFISSGALTHSVEALDVSLGVVI